MIKRSIIVALFLIAQLCFSDTHTPAPYDKDAIPQWAKDVRRFEIITLGSIPFAVMSYGFGKSCFDCAVHGFDTSYMSSPLERSTDGKVLAVSCCIGVGIGLCDLIINKIHRHKQEKQKKLQEQRSIYIQEYINENSKNSEDSATKDTKDTEKNLQGETSPTTEENAPNDSSLPPENSTEGEPPSATNEDNSN